MVAAAAARRREGCVQPVREPGALASGVCGATRLGSGWGGTPGWVFMSGAALGGRGGGRAVLQWQPGHWRLLTPALRCSRSWLSTAALSPGAPLGATVAPGTLAIGQQVAATSLLPNLANAG